MNGNVNSKCSSDYSFRSYLKSHITLLYNRLAPILAQHSVLKGANFAGLPSNSCWNPIITLKTILHDAATTSKPLWILSQDISKAFDSVNLNMLWFALERLKLPGKVIQLLLFLFINWSNHVLTADGPTPSYYVCIGLDQGEIIFLFLWVIYLDLLLTVLKQDMVDAYMLKLPSVSSSLVLLFSSTVPFPINNLVFMDDSTLIQNKTYVIYYWRILLFEQYFCQLFEIHFGH